MNFRDTHLLLKYMKIFESTQKTLEDSQFKIVITHQEN